MSITSRYDKQIFIDQENGKQFYFSRSGRKIYVIPKKGLENRNKLTNVVNYEQFLNIFKTALKQLFSDQENTSNREIITFIQKVADCDNITNFFSFINESDLISKRFADHCEGEQKEAASGHHKLFQALFKTIQLFGNLKGLNLQQGLYFEHEECIVHFNAEKLQVIANLKPLSFGGLGEVFRGINISPKKRFEPCAVKVAKRLFPNTASADQERLNQLARVALERETKNNAAVFAKAQSAPVVGPVQLKFNATVFGSPSKTMMGIVLPLKDGTLHDLFKDYEIDDETRIALCYQIIELGIALKENHFFHGDIKPGNILYKIKDDKIYLQFSDLDSFRLLEEPAYVMANNITGTPSYRTLVDFLNFLDTTDREQRKIILNRMDDYALGVLLFYMLSKGKLPYPTIKYQNLDFCSEHGYRGDESLKHVSTKGQLVLKRMLLPEPEERLSFMQARKMMLDDPQILSFGEVRQPLAPQPMLSNSQMNTLVLGTQEAETMVPKIQSAEAETMVLETQVA